MNSRTSKHMMITRDGGRTYHACEVDQDDNPIGPTRVITAEPETIPNGLSAVAERVSRFVTAASPKSSLLIFALDHTRGFSLRYSGGQTTISMHFTYLHERPEREQGIRDLFARNGIEPIHSADIGQEPFLNYPMPESAERSAALCAEILASVYGIADDEPLAFNLMQYP